MVENNKINQKLDEALKKDPELAEALIKMPNSYTHFVIGIFSGYDEYPDLKDKILEFLTEHQNATPSDVVLFYSEQFRGFKRKSKYSFEE